MRYVSTRGTAPELGFADVLLAGLARDGGLYVPAEIPRFDDARWDSMRDLAYVPMAVEVMWPFVEGDIERADFERIVTDAYASFSAPDVTPISHLSGDTYVLELWHGPTLAFKDVALQLVGRLFDHVLALRNERVFIIGATSGDTGSAAIDGVKNCDRVTIFIMHPAGRTSDVQRRQMTTVLEPNVFNLAVEGTFDDCQDLVKELFSDEVFRDEMHLSAVNSINWARVMAQVVYYCYASLRLGGTANHPVDFSVPTGNFGNLFAAVVAKRMGAPVGRLIIASNSNDILTRFVDSGVMRQTGVVETLSPSMDIQVSSNFERFLYDVCGRDGVQVADRMAQFRSTGEIVFSPSEMAEVRSWFAAASFDDDETTMLMADSFAHGVTLDPHTAVAVGAAKRFARAGTPMVVVGTAHPAKFPKAVERATGISPTLPAHLADLFDRPERYETVAVDVEEIEKYIRRIRSEGRDVER